MTTETDLFRRMWQMQEDFMFRLREHGLIGTHHQSDFVWPLDLSKRSSQLELKDVAFNSMSELFEAIQHLKNAKKHRQTEVGHVDREAFIEEAVDSFKFFLEFLIFAGITPDEFFDAYAKKDAVLHRRIDEKY